MQSAFQSPNDLTRTTLAVLFVCALIISTAWVASPFLSSLLWATMIVIPTWPVLLRIQSRLGGRRHLATAVMTIALLLILIIPLSLSVAVLVGNMDTIVAQAKALQTFELPPPPGWVAGIPFRGPKLAAEWQRLSAEGPGSVAARLAPYAGRALAWFAAQVGGLGMIILQFLLTVLIAAILYANGETAASGVRRFAIRLAGENGERACVLAAATIRSVAMGVIVTAIVQTLVAGIGLLVVRVPGAWLLTAAALIFCLAQIGPILVMLPAIVWKFLSGDSVGGFVLLAFALVAGTIDSLVRPLLIRRGADLPLILILAGVIGGMISIGFMGIFVGPVILAVTYVLLREWVNRLPAAAADPTLAARTQNAPG